MRATDSLPICDYCGYFVEETDQWCAALHDGVCALRGGHVRFELFWVRKNALVGGIGCTINVRYVGVYYLLVMIGSLL